MACYGALKALVARTFPGPAGAQLHNSLLKGLSGLKSAEPVTELWALARVVRDDAALSALFRRASAEEIVASIAADARYADFHAAFERYLDRWGFRCSGELMLTVASFQERPADLLEIVRAYARGAETSPQARLEQQQAERERITADALGQAARRRWLRFLPWPNYASVRNVLAQRRPPSVARARTLEAGAALQPIATHRPGDRRPLVAAGGAARTRGRLLPDRWSSISCSLAMFPHTGTDELRRAAHETFALEVPADVLVAREGE
jgi:pyruvate,water dikinase